MRKKLISAIVYGAYDDDGRVHYVGSTQQFDTRKKQHALRPAKALPRGLDLRELQRVSFTNTYDLFRAEGWWMVRLLLDGHPIKNRQAEGWPDDVLVNPSKYKGPLFCWAKSKGIWTGEAPRFLSVPETAALLGMSRQAVAVRCWNGSMLGAIKIGNAYAIPCPPQFTKATTNLAAQHQRAEEALRMVAKGMTAYAAAKKTGIALSTIYRAIKRQRESKSCSFT